MAKLEDLKPSFLELDESEKKELIENLRTSRRIPLAKVQATRRKNRGMGPKDRRVSKREKLLRTLREEMIAKGFDEAQIELLLKGV